MSLKGRSLELYFVDGHPDGIVTATMFDWPGHILIFPRTQLAAATQRDEFKRVGVYMLLGEKDGVACAYVGESEDLPARLGQHVSNKDWWTRAVLVTSTNKDLNKAHVRHMEARLYAEAKASGMLLDNGASPTKSYLSEAAQAGVEAFVERLLMVLPLLRVDVFLKSNLPKSADAPASAPVFQFNSVKHGISSEAVWMNGFLVVKAGATGRSWTGVGKVYKDLQEKMITSGKLVPQGDKLKLIVDHQFDSPSAAAAVLIGYNINGPVAWKLKGTSQTYKDWERANLEQPVVMKEAAE